MGLYENVLESISHDENQNKIFTDVVTFLIPNVKKADNLESNQTNTLIVNYHGNNVKETLKLGSSRYKYAGIKIGDYVIPYIPTSFSNKDFNNQCLRQWIRAIYSDMYNIQSNSDILLYLFLGDVLRIHLSDVSEIIKSTYKKMTYIMLDRRRYNSGGVKEIDHLRNRNPPMPVCNDLTTSNKIIEEMFETCMKLLGFNKNVSPYIFWYGILICLNDPITIESTVTI